MRNNVREHEKMIRDNYDLQPIPELDTINDFKNNFSIYL